MNNKTNFNSLKTQFDETKNQLQDILSENSKIKNILNEYFDTKSSFNIKDTTIIEKKPEEVNNEHDFNNEDNLNLFKEELKDLKSKFILIKNINNETDNYKSLTIDKNKSKIFLNNFEKPANNKESYFDSKNNFFKSMNVENEIIKETTEEVIDETKNEDLKEILGVFTSYGLDNKQLKDIFSFYFKNKNEFFYLIKTKNYEKIIVNWLKIVLDSHKINKLDIVEKSKLNNETFVDQWKKSINPKSLNNSKEKRLKKSNLKDSDDYISFNNEKLKSKNLNLKKKRKSLKKKKKLLNKSVASKVSQRYIPRFKTNNDATNLFKKRYQENHDKYSTLKPKKSVNVNGFESSLRNTIEDGRPKKIKDLKKIKEKKHFPDRQNFLYHSNSKININDQD